MIKDNLSWYRKVPAGIVFFFSYILYSDILARIIQLMSINEYMVSGYFIINHFSHLLVDFFFFTLFLGIMWLLIRKSVDFKRGLTVGIQSGVGYGLFFAGVETLILFLFHTDSFVYYFSEFAAKIALLSLINGTLTGILFGILFASFYNRIPGKKPVKKSLILAVVLWMVFPGILGFSYIAGEYIPLNYYILRIVIGGFFGFLILGYCNGISWEGYTDDLGLILRFDKSAYRDNTLHSNSNQKE